MKSIVVIGAGFFGLYLSEFLAKRGHSVTLIEKEEEAMMRASYINQARVHNGYHYPRSVLTAIRSKESFPIFTKEFKNCIADEFEKYYLIGKRLSKVHANQFNGFCDYIGVPCEKASESFSKYTDSRYVEESFRTVEYAFDSRKLRDEMLQRIDRVGVNLIFGQEVVKVTKNYDQKILVDFSCPSNKLLSDTLKVDHVFNCTYSMLNNVLFNSGIEIIPIKQEMVEICLMSPTSELKNYGVTVMCGPFFSFMPFPSTSFHSLTHVRYTPHCEWHEESGLEYSPSDNLFLNMKRESEWNKMIKDASRYMPLLSESEYDSSLWEVKTLMPNTELNDARPILFKKNYGIKGFHSVLGGKIDNVYDVLHIVASLDGI